MIAIAGGILIAAAILGTIWLGANIAVASGPMLPEGRFIGWGIVVVAIVVALFWIF